MDTELERRFGGIEARLAQVERLLAAMAIAPAQARQPAPPPQRPSTTTATEQRSAPTVHPSLPAPRRGDESRPALATSILGWGGALALVLAAAYLIRLAIDTGWLTPLRQVGLAAIAGLALIGAGFALRATSRAYAG